ncbi:MAG: hypothetical protein H7Z42_01155 [Roseiflexaceae bacterium]|nr:hypothetical protein [Roseiflexaceae bacterium]
MSSPAYLRAARQPLALAVLFVALLGGVVVSAWLLPVGLLAYALMVWLAANDRELRAEAAAPPRTRLTSPTFSAQMGLIDQSALAIRRSVDQSPAPLKNILTRVVDQARDLSGEAHSLSDKGQIIEQYLATVNQTALQKQIEALDIRLRSTQDTYTRNQLEETRLALTERQANASDLETYIGRISAQLQNIAASLDNVHAETVRLRTADAVSADSATSQVAQRLSDLRSDMDAFQRVLDTALTQSGAAA